MPGATESLPDKSCVYAAAAADLPPADMPRDCARADAIIHLRYSWQLIMAPHGDFISRAPPSVGVHVLYHHYRHSLFPPAPEAGAVFALAVRGRGDALHGNLSHNTPDTFYCLIPPRREGKIFPLLHE